MNVTTASFLGLRRQRAQEAPRKALKRPLRRAPASQYARANQKRAIRIAAIASVHVNCTVQSQVTLIHCIAHQLLVNLAIGAVWQCLPRRAGGVGPSVRMGCRSYRSSCTQVYNLHSYQLTRLQPQRGISNLEMAGRQALVVPALKKHTATVIMAHGLGDRSAMHDSSQ
jgi:hypothetical protein